MMILPVLLLLIEPYAFIGSMTKSTNWETCRCFWPRQDRARSFDSEFLWQTLDNGNISQAQSPMGQPRVLSSCASEERREKLSRYWNKKSKRNFGRKIKVNLKFLFSFVEILVTRSLELTRSNFFFFFFIYCWWLLFSMLAGKLWPIANQEFAVDLQRLKRQKLPSSNDRYSYEQE